MKIRENLFDCANYIFKNLKFYPEPKTIPKNPNPKF